MVSQVQNLGLGMFTAALHAAAARPKYLQWGEGSGQAVTDTAVDAVGATTEARTNGTSSVATVTTSNDTFQVVGIITALGARAITEVALFDGAGSGSPPTGDNMGVYGDHSVINLATGDSISYTIKVTLDQA